MTERRLPRCVMWDASQVIAPIWNRALPKKFWATTFKTNSRCFLWWQDNSDFLKKARGCKTASSRFFAFKFAARKITCLENAASKINFFAEQVQSAWCQCARAQSKIISTYATSAKNSNFFKALDPQAARVASEINFLTVQAQSAWPARRASGDWNKFPCRASTKCLTKLRKCNKIKKVSILFLEEF